MIAFGVDANGQGRTHADTGFIRVVVAAMGDFKQVVAILKSDGFQHAALRYTVRQPVTAGDIYRPTMLTEEQHAACKAAEASCDDGTVFTTWPTYLIQALAAMPAPFPPCKGAVDAYIPSCMCGARKYTVISLYS